MQETGPQDLRTAPADVQKAALAAGGAQEGQAGFLLRLKHPDRYPYGRRPPAEISAVFALSHGAGGIGVNRNPRSAASVAKASIAQRARIDRGLPPAGRSC